MIECLESRAREERDENAPALVENPSEDGERPRQPIRLQMNKRVPGENPGPPVFQAGKVGKRPEPERNFRVGPADRKSVVQGKRGGSRGCGRGARAGAGEA